ncbi:MAG: hypothetical protein FJ405_16500, partial [Verrucomicrobia bacterium]|nr:hypothetical protein [Verrucomicrobiota bacterium]
MINPPDALPPRSWLGWFASLLLAGQLIDTPHALAVVSEDLLPQQAEWITVADQHYPAGSAGVSFTRTFQVSLAPVKAILLAASDGTARIEINGTFVGVTTGVSNATTLDVTRHLTTGTNLLKVEVVQTPKPPALRVM